MPRACFHRTVISWQRTGNDKSRGPGCLSASFHCAWWQRLRSYGAEHRGGREVFACSTTSAAWQISLAIHSGIIRHTRYPTLSFRPVDLTIHVHAFIEQPGLFFDSDSQPWKLTFTAAVFIIDARYYRARTHTRMDGCTHRPRYRSIFYECK